MEKREGEYTPFIKNLLGASDWHAKHCGSVSERQHVYIGPI